MLKYKEKKKPEAEGGGVLEDGAASPIPTR